MSLMIASDLHGSALFCRQLLARFEAERPDGLLLLGDILYHGPRNDLPEGYDPRQVVALLNPLKDQIVCVRGNCDAEVDEMVLAFPFCAAPAALERYGLRLLAAHGHHIGPESPPAQPCDALLFGHTHVPCRLLNDGVWFLNPGSVSIPKENSPHGYLTLDGDGFTWKDLSGEAWDALPMARVKAGR